MEPDAHRGPGRTVAAALIGAALIITSLRNIRTFDAGFRRDQVLVQSISPEKCFMGDRVTRYGARCWSGCARCRVSRRDSP